MAALEYDWLRANAHRIERQRGGVRGYHLLGKMKSGRRARKLAGTVTQWRPTSSPGREVGVVQEPLDLGQPSQQYAVRTPMEATVGN